MKKIKVLYYKFRGIFLRQHPHFYSFCDKRKFFIKFFFAGIFAALASLLFLSLFYKYFGWGIVFSSSLAFILSFVVSFNLQKFWAFRNYHKSKIPLQLVIYMLNALVALSLNAYLMHLLVNVWQIWYLFAQVIVNCLIGFHNFFLYKFIIFPVKK